MTSTERRKRWQFFRENAGWVVGENAAGALELARAEELLEEAIGEGVALVDWREDPEPWQGLFEPAGAVFGCLVWVGAELEVEDGDDRYDDPAGWTDNASLWGIDGVDDPRAPYRRVVAAELALELVDELRQALGDARDAAAGVGGEVVEPR